MKPRVMLSAITILVALIMACESTSSPGAQHIHVETTPNLVTSPVTQGRKQPGTSTAAPVSQRYLKISLSEAKSTFESAQYKFEKGNPVNGHTSNYVGMDPSGLTLIQLIGDGDNLTEGSISVTPTKDKSKNELISAELALFAVTLVSDGDDAVNWVAKSMLLLTKYTKNAEGANRDISAIRGDEAMTLGLVPSLSIAILIIMPAPDTSLRGTVTVDGHLNVRAGPGTDNVRIGRLSDGDVVSIIGQYNKCEWLNVKAESLTGWIYGKYVKTSFDCNKVFNSMGEDSPERLWQTPQPK